MKTGILAGACLCALLLPLTSTAQQAQQARPLLGGHGNNVQAFIAQHDENGDGRVTATEFEAFRRARFNETDANKDGTVDEAEYVQEFATRSRQALAQERRSQIEQTKVRFAALDTDKDGKISRAEFDATGEKTWEMGQKALAARAKESAGESEVRFDRDGGRAGMPTSHSAEGFAALYDENGDGKVEREEYDRLREAQFVRGDTDKDGALSQQEYLAEFEDRLNRRITSLEQAGNDDPQAHVRFKVLDTDKDARMTFAEYQASGLRTFERVDRNHDGVVDAADAALPPPPPRTPASAAKPAKAD